MYNNVHLHGAFSYFFDGGSYQYVKSLHWRISSNGVDIGILEGHSCLLDFHNITHTQSIYDESTIKVLEFLEGYCFFHSMPTFYLQIRLLVTYSVVIEYHMDV